MGCILNEMTKRYEEVTPTCPNTSKNMWSVKCEISRVITACSWSNHGIHLFLKNPKCQRFKSWMIYYLFDQLLCLNFDHHCLGGSRPLITWWSLLISKFQCPNLVRTTTKEKALSPPSLPSLREWASVAARFIAQDHAPGQVCLCGAPLGMRKTWRI